MNRSINLEILLKEFEKQITTFSVNSSSIFKILAIYCPPVIIILGSITNIFSLLIFIQLAQFKIGFNIIKFINNFTYFSVKSSNNANVHQYDFNLTKVVKNQMQRNGLIAVYFYLAILCIFDLGVLYFGLLNDWIIDLNLFNFKNSNRIACKMFTFLAFLCSHLSSSLIVVTCLLRLVAIYSPIKAAKLTNKNSFRKTCLFLLLFFSLINLHLFWTMNLVPIEHFLITLHKDLIEPILKDIDIPPNYQCQFRSEEVFKQIWPVIDKLFYFFLPFCVIFFVNITIILNISKTQKYKYYVYVSKIRSNDSTKNGMTMFAQNKPNSHESSQNTFKNRNITYAASNFNQLSNQAENIKFFGRKITFTLLGISFLFLILTLPVMILYIFLKRINILIESSSNSEKYNEWLGIAQKFTGILMYLNHSLNFFVYYFTGARFRQKFWKFLKIKNNTRKNGLTPKKELKIYQRSNHEKNLKIKNSKNLNLLKSR